MVDRLGFVPPSEATLPCHDICHIFDEISTHGLIRYRNLFKFERMNSFMKQTLKNRAHGIASIMKNYNTHERTTMSGTIYLDNVAKFQSLCKLQPINGLPFQSLGSYVTSIHVEPPEETGEDRTILYDIPSSNVIEFRGASMNITLTRQDINYLLEDNMDICYEAGFSVLKCIMVGYKTHCTKYPQQFKGDMLGYMRFLLDGSHPTAYQRVIKNFLRRKEPRIRRQIEEDLAVLRNLAVDMREPSLEVRFVTLLCCL
jgi:hypothetical protein